jgi:hypothetical protein
MSPETVSFSFPSFLADHEAGRVPLVQFPPCFDFHEVRGPFVS